MSDNRPSKQEVESAVAEIVGALHESQQPALAVLIDEIERLARENARLHEVLRDGVAYRPTQASERAVDEIERLARENARLHEVLYNVLAYRPTQASERAVDEPGDGLPRFYTTEKCSQCGKTKDWIARNGCPEKCGRGAEKTAAASADFYDAWPDFNRER